MPNRPYLFTLLVLSTLAIVGCSTPYQEDSLTRELLLVNTGGHRTTQIAENKFKIEYNSTPGTPNETLEKFITYRCSTLTLEKGYTGFSFDVPITETPPHPKTKRNFYAYVTLHRQPYPQQLVVIDAASTRANLESFVRSQ